MFFDELDSFMLAFRTRHFDRSEPKPTQEDEDIIDEILDLLLDAFWEGSKQAAEELLVAIKPDIEDARNSIHKKIDGKDFADRVRAYLNGDMGKTTGTPEEAIMRVVETDAVRVFNEGGYSTAKRGGATKKTWVTMGDLAVREQHAILDGTTAPIDGYFYTYDDRAEHPGGFTKAENNCACRCWITFSK